MPKSYRRKRTTYRRKKTYRKKKSTRGTINYKKVMDKKINTSIERRMVEIAQAQKPALISRTWLTDPPNQSQIRDTPPVLGAPGEALNECAYTDITTTPFISDYIDRIRKTDINMPLNVEDPTLPSGAAVTRGMITAVKHGFRSNNRIAIKGINLDIRIRSDFGIERLAEEPPSNAAGHIRNAYEQTAGRITLQYKLVEVSVSPNQALPDGEDIAILALKYNNWGYSSVLDVALKEDERTYKYKTILSGNINCSPQISFTKVGHENDPLTGSDEPSTSVMPFFREFSQYRKFANPIRIEYDPRDQNGINKTTKALYFVAKSNVQPGQTPPEQCAAPRIAVICKVYYTDD